MLVPVSMPVVVPTVLVAVIVLVFGLNRSVHAAPDGDGAKKHDAEKADTTGSNGKVELVGQQRPERTGQPQRDRDAGDGSADADHEQLIEVICGAIRVMGGVRDIGHWRRSPGRGFSFPGSAWEWDVLQAPPALG